MAKLFLVSIDLNKNELQNARVQNLASAPSSPVTGQLYYDTGTNRLYCWNGSIWVAADGGSISFGSPVASAVGDTSNDGSSGNSSRADHRHPREAFAAVSSSTSFGQAAANGSAITLPRSDHLHGTPTHDNAAHAAVALSALGVPTGSVTLNSQKIINLLDPTSAQDAATKAYVDATAQGLDVKLSVRAASTGNINTASPGTTIDGVTLANGDRVLLKDQSTGSQNGIYVFNGSGSAMTRSTDADTSVEVNPGMFTWVEEGTVNADSGWILTTNAPITLATTSLTFTLFSSASALVAGNGLTKSGNAIDVGPGNGILVTADTVTVDPAVVVRKFAASVGDGSATSFNVDHNLNTLDVTVGVFRNSDGVEMIADITRSTVNRVVIVFAVAPSSNQYRVVVHG